MPQDSQYFDFLDFYLRNASVDQLITTLALPASDEYSDLLKNQHAAHIEQFFENAYARRGGEFVDEYVHKQLARTRDGQLDYWTLLLTGHAPRPPKFTNEVLTRFLTIEDDYVFCDMVEGCLAGTNEVPDIAATTDWDNKLRLHFAGYAAIDAVIARYKNYRSR